MKDKEYDIIKNLYRSETLVNRLKKDAIDPYNIILIIAGSDTLSVEDKISSIKSLSNIHGYKRYYDHISNLYNNYLNYIKNNEMTYVINWVKFNDNDYDLEDTTIGYDLDDTINRFLEISDDCIPVNYFVIDMFDAHYPNKLLYKLYAKYDQRKHIIIYDIRNVINEVIDSVYCIKDSISIFGNYKKFTPHLYCRPNDEIYIESYTAGGYRDYDCYHAIISDISGVSFISKNNSYIFQKKLLSSIIDKEFDIPQSPVYTMLYESDPEYPKHYYANIDYIKYLVKNKSMAELDDEYEL